MRVLIFSDIHNDQKDAGAPPRNRSGLLHRRGDLVSWAKGFEKIAPILAPKKDRVYVIPGNHESESDIARFCGQHGFHDLHGRTLEINGTHVAALGYSNITPFDTPGEYSEEELARRLALFAELKPLVSSVTVRPKRRRSIKSSRASTQARRASATSSKNTSPHISSAATSTRPREPPSRWARPRR